MYTKSLPHISLLGFLWGTNLVAARFGVGQFHPVLFAGLRLVLSIIGFVGIYALSSKRHWPRDGRLWRQSALLGIFGGAIPMVALISALQYQSSGVTALLITTAPAIIVLMAHFYLPDEQLNRYKTFGVILALAGAALIVVRGETGLPDLSRANPLGYVLVVVSLISDGGATVYIRKHMREQDSFQVTSVRLLVAGLLVMPAALLLTGFHVADVTYQGVLALAYAAFAGVFAAQMLAFYITKRYGATAFSMTAYVIPVVAAVAGVILLGETITLWMIAGMVLIGLGIRLINQRQA